MKWFRFPRILGIVVCLYLVGLVALFGLLSMQSSHFVRNAGSAEGTVVALVPKAPVGSNRTSTTSSRTVSLAPRVEYVVAGTTYEYTPAHGRLHQTLKVGDRVPVQYDPDQPARARLKGEGRILVPGIAVGFAVAAVAVVVILVRTRKAGTSAARPARRDPLALNEVEQHPSR